MIRIHDVSMQYELGEARVRVLDEVNLAVARGERVAITGPSGSGKTTLLLLLAGLERPSGGSVELDGVRIDRLSADELADLRRDHVGIVFQSFHLIPGLTALENVALPLDIAGKRDTRARARELLAAVGLTERQAHYPAQLSGGEQQRVAIARALAHSPKLLLADEPTGNLDDRTGESVAELLFELNEREKTTLVLVTHNRELAARCDRVLRLHEGALSDA
jgi:putative ABC transport system ATP-binding protein